MIQVKENDPVMLLYNDDPWLILSRSHVIFSICCQSSYGELQIEPASYQRATCSLSSPLNNGLDREQVAGRYLLEIMIKYLE